MLKEVFAFEGKNFLSKKNFIIFFAFFILLSAFSWEGISDYKTIEESKKPFQEMEKEKVSLFIHYTLYGIRGVRLLLMPSPISVIFNNSEVYNGMTAKVDTGEGLYLYNSFNGKDLFALLSGYTDFSGLMLLLGCFLALIYGYFATQNKGYLKLLVDIYGKNKIILSIILSRIILLNLALLVISGLSLLCLLAVGINIANVFFLAFAIELILVVTIFLLIGAIGGSLKKKISQLTVLTVVSFALLLVIPWLVQKFVYMEAAKSITPIYEFEYKKLKVIMTLEKRLFKRFGVWNSGKPAPEAIKSAIQKGLDVEYKKLREYENERLEDIYKRIKAYQAIAAIFPSTFYMSVNKELSSKGFQNFIDFYKYAYEMKYKFIKFYIEKKFYNPYPKTGVEPFFKGDENIFEAQSQLPYTFWMGNGLMLLYIISLLVTLHKLHVNIAKDEKLKRPQIKFEKEQSSLFVLCENDTIKQEIFRFYERQHNTTCIDKIVTDSSFDDFLPNEILHYFCNLSNGDIKKAIEILTMVGIKDLNTLEISHENILKIYAAVKISADYRYIIFNDFFKKESRRLEEDFSTLLSHLKASGKRILYLSCEMYYPKESLNEKISIKNFGLLPLNFDKVTLR